MTPDTTPSVQYTYADGAAGGVAKYVRLTDVIYPNGRDVQYGYGTTGAVDDIMSRLADHQRHARSLRRLQVSRAGHDRRSRTTSQAARQARLRSRRRRFLHRPRPLRPHRRPALGTLPPYGGNEVADGTVDEYTYTYDRAGNVHEQDERARTPPLDEIYGYNDLDELTSVELGTAAPTQSWTLDSLGNWLDFTDGSDHRHARRSTPPTRRPVPPPRSRRNTTPPATPS